MLGRVLVWAAAVLAVTLSVVLARGRSESASVSAATLPKGPVDVLATASPGVPVRKPIEDALRDPFAAVKADLPTPVPVVQVHVPPASAVAPPQAPPLGLRFDGRATSPSGEQMVFASLNEAGVILQVGLTLSNGYVVRSISDQAVEFEYPPLGTKTSLALPPAPSMEIR